jgi:exosortase
MTTVDSRPPLTLLAKLNLGLLAGLIIALSFRLWPEWLHNPDLSHGLFMPFLFLLMLHESRSAGPHRYLRPSLPVYAAFGLSLTFALIALGLAGIYAASLGWTHALVEFLLVASLVFLLGAALVNFSSERTRLIPCNWPAFVAIGLWLLSAPIPPGTYSRLTVGLQLFVSENVLRALHVLGVAARREGNVIELASATVGIEEACSGVRSLISCVFAGFFFSATLVRRPWARALVIILAAPLAMLMNFIRSLTLTLLANSGIDITGTWHDVTGFAVLGVTAALLGGLALLLERRTPSAAPTPPVALPRPSFINPQLVLTVALFLSLALIGFFVRNTRPALRPSGPPPNLLAILPSASPGWRVDTSRDLYQFSDILKTEFLAQRSYLGRTAAGPTEVTIYLAYWRAGQSSVSSVAAHTRLTQSRHPRVPGRRRSHTLARRVPHFSKRRPSPACVVLASLRRPAYRLRESLLHTRTSEHRLALRIQPRRRPTLCACFQQPPVVRYRRRAVHSRLLRPPPTPRALSHLRRCHSPPPNASAPPFPSSHC